MTGLLVQMMAGALQARETAGCGVTVVNPFATPHAPLLGGILGIGRQEK